MKKLGYLPMSYNWVRLYYSIISEYNKGLTTDTFCVFDISEDLEYVIFVTTDAYNIGIDNPNIKLII